MIPYMHVQGAHALEMIGSIHPYSLGRLRNEVMERKHREMKNLNTNQRGGRGVDKVNISTFERDIMCLVMRRENNFSSL